MIPQFKKLDGLPHTLICSDGYIINTNNGYVYKNILKRTGYTEVYIDGKGYLLHRLVALAFCDGYEKGKEVNHKDGNKQNNHFSNLEWVSHSDNLKHAFLIGLRECDVSSRKVVGTDMVTGEKMVFSSIYKAAKLLGISQGNICLCCKGKRPYANGFYWEYAKGV